jgi:hypothetical protein
MQSQNLDKDYCTIQIYVGLYVIELITLGPQ